MNKPIEILEIERIYGIRLEEGVPDGDGYVERNCYAVDTEGAVTRLNLSYNQLGEIKGFESLVGLQELDLSSNQLTEIKGLENFVSLQELNLSHNQLTEIKGLENLVGLKWLDLFSNRLTEIKGLENLVGLKLLNLSHNQLMEIKGLENLFGLKWLDLSHNQLTGIKRLETLVDLQRLYLSNNQLGEIKGLETFVNLQQLGLSGNQLREIKGLENLVSLKLLDLSHNQLTGIKGIKRNVKLIDRLIYLRIDNNPFLKNTNLLLSAGPNHRDIILKYLFDIEKPKEILELEHIYGITLRESVPNIYEYIGDNCYVADTEGIVLQLNLSNNQLTEIKGLEKLVGLQQLYLSGNHLTEIKGLEELVCLQRLYLSNNQLTEIKGLETLVDLQRLDLAGTHLKEIKGLDNLISLQQLNLYNNQLTEIKGLGTLISLQQLNLSHNQLAEIKGFETLISLQQLNLSYNQLTEIKGLASIIDRLDNLYIGYNPPLNNTDLSLEKEYDNHRDIILKYFSDLKQTKIEVTLPAKVMLLGNHAAGKTTFRHYMLNGKLIEPKSTPILEIIPYPKRWTARMKLPEAIIFDFGGQDYYHGLYQAFFSEDPIYMLFWCNKSNRNDVQQAKDGTNSGTRNFTIEYWQNQLKYVNAKRKKEREEIDTEEHSFIDSILLVQTHVGEETTGRIAYREKAQLLLENIVDEYRISLGRNTQKDTLHKLKRKEVEESLLKEIREKRQPRKEGEYYERFLNYILTWDTEKCVKVDEVLKKYDREEENEENKRAILKVELEILNRKGLVLYYKESDLLKNVVWLNPAKTVEYIHKKVLSKKEVKIKYKGIVPKDVFEDLCSDEKIKELLICEKVIFFDEQNKQYIIPGYLPLLHEDPHYNYYRRDFVKPNFTLKFRYFIPFGLINQLICLYGDNLGDKMFWRDQLMFTYNDEYKLYIKLDFSQLTIAVYINSLPENYPEELTLKEVEKTIFRNIIDLYWGKEVNHQINRNRENLYVSGKKRKLFTVQVQAYLKRWDATKDIPEDMYLSLGEDLFVRAIDLGNVVKSQTAIPAYGLIETEEKTINEEKIKMLESIPTQTSPLIALYKNFTNNKNICNMKKIFISFAEEDKEYKNEFMRHTITMQKNGLIDKPFACSDIELGIDWDDKIKKEINDCDIMICLVSSDFLNSDYINNVEIKRAMEQKKTLIPIIVRPCDWKTSEVGIFQAALGAKYITLKSNDLTEYTKNERDAQWLKIIKEMRAKLFPDYRPY
jgi:internalin A